MKFTSIKALSAIALGAGLFAIPAFAQTTELVETTTIRTRDVPASAIRPAIAPVDEYRGDGFSVQMGAPVEADDDGGPDYAPDETTPAYKRNATVKTQKPAVVAEPDIQPAPLPKDPPVQHYTYPPTEGSQPISPPPHRANAVRIPPSAWLKNNDQIEVKEANGIKYVTGGVGEQSRMQMDAIKGDFNLQVTSAASSGEFMGVTGIAITDTKGNVLVQTRVEPLFYAALPPGKYIVAAHVGDAGKQQTIVVDKKKPNVVKTVHFGW